MATAAGEHAGHDGAGEQHRGLEVDRQGVGDIGFERLVEPGDALDAGVVDENVDHAELDLGAPDQLRPVRCLGDVTLDGNGPHAESLHLRSHLLEIPE